MADGWSKSISASSGMIRMSLEDMGEQIASFRMNPADIKLVQRCQEVSAFFEDLRDKTPDNATLEEAAQFNDEMETKICYLLGYDAKQSLFGLLSATSIMGDGNLFIVHVMDQILKAVGPEIKKRQQAMAKAVSKHTAKYQK